VLDDIELFDIFGVGVVCASIRAGAVSARRHLLADASRAVGSVSFARLGVVSLNPAALSEINHFLL